MFNVVVKMGDDDLLLQAQDGQNLLKLLRDNDVPIPSACGGRQFCGKCKVEVLKGDKTLGHYTAGEMDSLSYLERQMGYHLACAIAVSEDMEIAIVNMEEEARIMTDSVSSTLALEPDIYKYHLVLPKPTISDQRSDLKRIEDAVNISDDVDRSILCRLPDILRSNDFNVTAAFVGDELIDIEGGDTTAHKYGIAIDIGTTTVVGFLMDMNTGLQLDVYSFLNSQRSRGADVISRIDYTINNAEGLEELGRMIIDDINDMIEVFTNKNNISRNNIYEVAVVGNTVMMHLLFRLPVKYIATSPFTPVIAKRYSVKAKEAGIDINPNGYVYQIPNVAGYVGADTVAAILACDMAQQDSISLMLDIGTNGEIALGNKEMIYACSTAAGPAFEGAQIRNGIGGVKGAINKITLDGGVDFTTIGGEQPIGICGSGIVDAISEMLKAGIIDEYGRIKTRDELAGTPFADRIIEIDNKPAFLLAHMDNGESIAICQKDVRELQLAKGAIAAGVRILMKEAGITMDQIEHVYLAGGFGNYIDYNSACNIGLLPMELRDKITGIGNGAGAGAKMCLMSQQYMKKAEAVRDKIHYIELSTRRDFQDIFMDLMGFSI